MNKCTDFSDFYTDYIDGALSEKMRMSFDAHLNECIECKKRLDNFRTVIPLLNQLPEEVLPTDFKSRFVARRNAEKLVSSISDEFSEEIVTNFNNSTTPTAINESLDNKKFEKLVAARKIPLLPILGAAIAAMVIGVLVVNQTVIPSNNFYPAQSSKKLIEASKSIKPEISNVPVVSNDLNAKSKNKNNKIKKTNTIKNDKKTVNDNIIIAKLPTADKTNDMILSNEKFNNNDDNKLPEKYQSTEDENIIKNNTNNDASTTQDDKVTIPVKPINNQLSHSEIINKCEKKVSHKILDLLKENNIKVINKSEDISLSIINSNTSKNDNINLIVNDNYLLTGKIVDITNDTQLGLVHIDHPLITSKAELDIRIVDVKTGEIVMVDNFFGTEKGRNIDYNSMRATDKAVAQAINTILIKINTLPN